MKLELQISINRNIVECKEKRERKVENAGYGINRNIVECKAGLYTGISTCADVLIETLWNVKIYFTQFSAKVILVLIETLWNVKDQSVCGTDQDPCINRNIVECKVRKGFEILTFCSRY